MSKPATRLTFPEPLKDIVARKFSPQQLGKTHAVTYSAPDAVEAKIAEHEAKNPHHAGQITFTSLTRSY